LTGEGVLTSHADLVQVIREIHDDRGLVAPNPAPGPPDVTVSMPARNVERFIVPAIRSVLAQEGVTLEVIVVDDASEDGTAAAAASVDDPRVRLFRNATRRGIGACHNRVLHESDAAFVAHVDADDFIVPWALRRMLDALRECPRAAQAYANHLLVGEDGSLSEREYAVQRTSIERMRGLVRDYRRGLLVHGMVTNTLRTYRRDALAEVGPFDERLPWAVDYEMSVRLANRYDMVLVPEFLYLQRVHDGNTQQTLGLRAIRSWRVRAAICGEQLRSNGGRLLGRSRPGVYGLLFLGLLHVARDALTGSGDRG
jgi:glycosyltransferase involved in cell wall biosynthesis